MNENIVPSLALPVGTLWKKLQNELTKKGVFRVATPLSNTPLPIYHWVLEHVREFENWEKVEFILMDEMLDGLSEPFSHVSVDDSASYEGFAMRHFLEPLKERTGKKVSVVKPVLSSITTFYTPIDLLIVALGVKGNYANVMPGTSIDVGWHIAHLISEFRQIHTEKGKGAFQGAHFREYGMTLGPQQILAAKNCVVIASGEQKKNLVHQLKSYDRFDEDFPLSIIYHPEIKERVMLFLTQDTQNKF